MIADCIKLNMRLRWLIISASILFRMETDVIILFRVDLPPLISVQAMC